MAINAQDHESVPDHRKLEEDEVEEILEKYNTSKEKLPKIKDNDAALKQFDDIEIGDVIEIVRESPTAGTTTYYRKVVER
jgi:DNA-directed RNA polymerase subunit H (RpoH/RPB5)